VRLCRARQQGADGCDLQTADCGGWSLLPAARCFLPSLESGDVLFHVHRQTRINFKSLFCFSLCCCPNTTRFDRNKLISSPAQTKIVRTLPVKAEACFPCPSISKSCSCSFSHPPSRMHADVFVSLPLSPSRRLAYCTCDTPRMSLDSLGIILRRCT
jgi:hypothetical protein